MKQKTIDVTDVACPVCDSRRDARVVRTRDFTYGVQGEYQFVRCEGCRHIFLNPQPCGDSIMDCYPQHYAPYHATDAEGAAVDGSSTQAAETKSRLRLIAARLPFLRSFLFWLGQDHGTVIPPVPSPGESRMLEIGCADGRYLLAARDKGWVVDGIEPSAEAVARCQSHGLQVQRGMFGEVATEARSREAIALWMVLEHVAAPVGLIDKARQTLVDDGLLLLSVPNGGAWERRVFGRYWLGYDAPRHLQVFTASQMRRVLTEQGFRVERIIHQANTRYWFGSVAAWGLERFPNRTWPSRWMGYFMQDPPAWYRWLMLVPGKAVSLLRCSGRITVVARKAR